jgi:hypothetical protein
MGKPVEIPYAYGEVLAITGTGTKIVVWMKDANSAVHGMILDITDPANPVLGKDEILLKRKTEGQVRRKKLPPVGQPLDAAALSPAPARPAASAPRPSMPPPRPPAPPPRA